MRDRLFIVGLTALVLTACQAPAGEAQTAPAAAPATAGFSAPRTVGTHTVTGVLHGFEDAGYPMFALEVGSAGGAAGDEANLQLLTLDTNAGGPVDPAAIQPLVGQAVTVRYSVTASTQMTDILVNGASVLLPVEGGPGPAAGTRTIEGVLSGAEGESGDLPSSLTVTASDGTAVTFDAFIEPGMAGANGRTVTLRYVDDVDVELVSFTPAG